MSAGRDSPSLEVVLDPLGPAPVALGALAVDVAGGAVVDVPAAAALADGPHAAMASLWDVDGRRSDAYVGFVVDVPPEPARQIHLEIVAGNGQRGLEGRCAPVALMVRAADNGGSPVAGVPVDFAAGDGSLFDVPGFSRVTDAAGIAGVGYRFGGAGQSGGPIVGAIVASVAGAPEVTPVTFSATTYLPHVYLSRFSGNFAYDLHTTPYPGEVSDTVLDVDVYDENGRTMAGVEVATSGDDDARWILPQHQSTDANGRASFLVVPFRATSVDFVLPEFPLFRLGPLGSVASAATAAIAVQPFRYPLLPLPITTGQAQVVLPGEPLQPINIDLRGVREQYGTRYAGVTIWLNNRGPLFVDRDRVRILNFPSPRDGPRADARVLDASFTIRDVIDTWYCWFWPPTGDGVYVDNEVQVLDFALGVTPGAEYCPPGYGPEDIAFDVRLGVTRPEIGYVTSTGFKVASSLPNQILGEINFGDPSAVPAVVAEYRVPKGYPAHVDESTHKQYMGGTLTTFNDCRQQLIEDGKFPPVGQGIRLDQQEDGSARFDVYRSIPIIVTLQSAWETLSGGGPPKAIYQRVDGPVRLEEEGLVFGLDQELKPMIKILAPAPPVEIDRGMMAELTAPETVNGRVNLSEGQPTTILFQVSPAREDGASPRVDFTQSPEMGIAFTGAVNLPIDVRPVPYLPSKPAAGSYVEGEIRLTVTSSNGQTAVDKREIRVGLPPIPIGVNVWILRGPDGTPLVTPEKVGKNLNRANTLWTQASIQFPYDQLVMHDPVPGTAGDGTDLLQIDPGDVTQLAKLVRNNDGSLRVDPRKANVFYVRTIQAVTSELSGLTFFPEQTALMYNVEDALVILLEAQKATGNIHAHELGHALGNLQDLKRLLPGREGTVDVNLMASPDPGYRYSIFGHALVDGLKHEDFSGAYSGSNPGPEITEDQVAVSRDRLSQFKVRHP